MRFDRFPFARVVVAGSAILPGLAGTPVLAQAPGAPAVQQTIDGNLLARGLELFNQGNYAEAAKSFEMIPQQVPTSPFIPEATFRLGYIAYLQGEYDKSVQYFEKVPTLKNVPPEIAELAASLTPQVSSAKASKMPAGDPAQKGAYEDAIRQFDQFIQKYPQSAEVESANYGKSVALYQVGRYEDAANTLRGNLQKFANSPSVLDSQYLLALTIGTLANVTMQKATAKDASAEANYNEAEKLLNDIINKRTDIALLNDARFQIAELNFARAGFAQKKEKEALYQKALDNYRAVAPKEIVLQAQKMRIEQIRQAGINFGKSGDVANFKRYQRFVEKEREKLVQFESRPDQTFTAKLKSAQIFFQQGKPDESRTLLNFIKDFAGDDAEAKKQIAYFTTLSYATQNIDTKGHNEKLAGKTEETYKAFRGAYNKDKIGENLAILVGSGFIESAPDKAISYFKESLEDYPDGRFKVEALTQQAAALTKLQRFDEAMDLYKKTLASSNNKEISAAAEFGIGDIQRQTGKQDEAIATFKKVRDSYGETSQAASAAYFVGQLTLEKGDAKTAITELETFKKKFGDSAMMPEAMFTLGNAQTAAGQKEAALSTYKEVSSTYPDSKVAPYAYFQRGTILNADGKQDETVAIMKEFIQKFPDSGDALFQAYDFIAQVYASQSKPADAVTAYEEFVKNNPQNPAAPQALLKIGAIQKTSADQMGRYVALKDEQKAEWTKGIDGAIATAERIVNEYPESEEVALGLKQLLDCQKLRQQAKLITEADVEKYFQDLAKKFAAQPATRSKIIFTLASYTFEKDKAKAIEQMASVYDANQKYAPGDLDLYGQALIEQGKLDEANKVFAKLSADYEIPKNTDPTKAPRDVQEAQSIALFGTGKVLQKQNKLDAAKQKFDELEKLYGWSPKMQEANYGIALGLHEQKAYDDALKRLLGVVNSKTASAELRAHAMLLFARINEDKGQHESAIDNYIKVARLYTGVPDAAAEGLWRGAQLLEKQANGQLAMPTPPPKAAPAKPGAAGGNAKPAAATKSKTSAAK
ncbi:tetratricopeptide repeat protein [Verrucomicrobiota bacterium sgz303538]